MRQCRECDDTGLINLGPTERDGPNVWENCRCNPQPSSGKTIGPDDLMEAAEKQIEVKT